MEGEIVILELGNSTVMFRCPKLGLVPSPTLHPDTLIKLSIYLTKLRNIVAFDLRPKFRKFWRDGKCPWSFCFSLFFSTLRLLWRFILIVFSALHDYKNTAKVVKSVSWALPEGKGRKNPSAPKEEHFVK